MAEPLLIVSDLIAGYGDVQVLWGINLAVREGEIACLVGSNGAGKTTLMRSISGVCQTSGGSIRFNGTDITSASPNTILKAGISHVPEGRRLFQGLSVKDNLLLGAYLRNDHDGIKQDLEKVFDLWPILRKRQHQDATTMSGGQQQMCAIARGIMSRPKLLMIDELSLGLAPKLVEELAESLIEINKMGTTVVVVEQDVMTAFELAEHAFVVETGKILKSGPTSELSDDPIIREAYLGM
ncbi:ABC transporter ATP-binding protein [Leisingera daeponensis]|uniref:ABC transporter ATP-binding protein n=1 Tax=Leisingera daeponensis TaxID=405746 RepID=UPI001C9396FA|nr:ABC transporter ATP-binding protein [Leisingera daeponensis]MBY6058780.1 ABC transporter ATP-binding protein [Leisingera daeponensis]